MAQSQHFYCIPKKDFRIAKSMFLKKDIYIAIAQLNEGDKTVWFQLHHAENYYNFDLADFMNKFYLTKNKK